MLGQILQKAIKNADIPISDAAAYMGVSETNLYRLFKKDSFEVSYLKKAAALLNLPLSHFFDEASSTGMTTQTGDFNQAGSGNQQKIRVSSKAPAQELAAQLLSCQKQLAITEALVASQSETITLLRASYNRPN